jgi:hypothetical protein
LARDGVLHPLSQFLSSSVSIYEGGSVVGRVADLLIKRSFWWALEHLNLVTPEGGESAAATWKRVVGDYVVISVVEVSEYRQFPEICYRLKFTNTCFSRI